MAPSTEKFRRALRKAWIEGYADRLTLAGMPRHLAFQQAAQAWEAIPQWQKHLWRADLPERPVYEVVERGGN